MTTVVVVVEKDKFNGDPVPTCDTVLGYYTTFADWGAARRKTPISEKEPYEVQPETWKGVAACCLLFLILLAGAIALSVVLPMVFHAN